MKAVAVRPGNAGSAHLAELAEPALEAVPDGRGVLVSVLRVGVDGTDREVNEAKYGRAPDGAGFLVLGHEALGRVERVGPGVRELAPGDHVVPMVRRPGSSPYDRIGRQDLTLDEHVLERGINGLHGFLTERIADSADWLVKVPDRLLGVAVLLEPLSIVEKGLAQAWDVQRRLPFWRPRRAAVAGPGTIGLLAALGLRLRGLEVDCFGLEREPYRNAELARAIGCSYASTRDVALLEAGRRAGGYDLVFEATGFSPLAFEAMRALAPNGIVVLTSVTGGDRRAELATDAVNQWLVLGNRAVVGSVNAAREHFEAGVRDMAQAEWRFPGWLAGLLTHPVEGLDRWPELFEKLSAEDAIKVYCRIAE